MNTKITVYLYPAVRDALERVSYAEALSSADVINRAISIYASLSGAPPNSSMSIVNIDGSTWKSVTVK